MDIDELLSGRPSSATAKTGRFQPNAGKPRSKPNLKPKLEPKPEPITGSAAPSPLPLPKSEPAPDDKKPILHPPPGPGPDSSAVAFVPDSAPIANDEAVANTAAAAAADDDEEGVEDCVVKEFDVFFNPSPLGPNTQLYILQYPVRPSWRPYELDERCLDVRVNAEQSKVEIDLEINVGKDNFDEAVAESLSFKKQTLSSSKAPLVTSYAVGVLSGNKLHLNPIHAVVQLRPSTTYLDFRLADKSTGSEDASNSEEKKWTSLGYHAGDSSFSSKYRQNLKAEESSPIQFPMSSLEYVNSFCPSSSDGPKTAKAPSVKFLLTLPLQERIKKWFSEGPEVSRFKALMHLAPGDSEENVLDVIQRHADLVQGLWVAKSLLRCDDIHVRARDYILLSFSESKTITVNELKDSKIRPEILRDVLNPLAVRRTLFEDWKFKEPEDSAFIKAHEDIVENQRLAWKKRQKDIMDAVGIGRRNLPVVSRDQGARGRNTADNSKQGVRGIDASPSSGMKMSSETREALPKALEELFRIHKVCSLRLICNGLREMALSKTSLPKADATALKAAALAADSPAELQFILDQHAIKVHGVYVRKSLSNPNIDPLRSVVINLFKGKEPNAKVKKADIIQAAKIVLQRDVSTSEYNQAVTELCTSIKGGAWMLKSGDGNPK